MYKGINKRRFFIFTLLTLCWAGIIFSFSLQPADTSNEMSGGFLRWIVEHVLPGLNENQLEIFHIVVRKCAHFIEFFILGLLSILTMLQTRFRCRPILAQLFCVLAASTDETIQLFVSGRSGQLSDVLLDSTGAAVGIAMICVMLPILSKIFPALYRYLLCQE